ncbi:hypothetical protein ACRARH_14735 [Phytobacter ursingii]
MIKNRLMRATLAFSLLMAAFSSHASNLHSGVYEGLILAISPAGHITGYYAESAEDGVKRTCSFSLSGQVSAQETNAITSWSSSVLPGQISASTDGVKLTIPDGQTHAGCINVLMPEINTGLELETTQETHWQALAQANAERVYLSSTADVATRRKAWIVKGDVVGVLQTQAGWTQIEFISGTGKTIRGWVNNKEIQPLTPPAS